MEDQVIRTLLIDGDILAFTVAARTEQKFDWGDGVKTRESDFETVKAESVAWVNQLKKDLDADTAIVAMSDPARRYFRHDVYSEYKSHRTHGETPLFLFETKGYLLGCEEFKPYMKPRLEADDILGILATMDCHDRGQQIIVTADKDLDQIVGLHFNPRKPEKGIRHVDHNEADYFFYTQALTGDPTDGFPGCPGIGPKRAAKILRAARERYTAMGGHPSTCTPEWLIWQFIEDAYIDRGRDPQYALMMARTARILRASDYDFPNKRPILWTPQAPPETPLPASSSASR